MNLPVEMGTHSYIGIAPCGCARAIMHDGPSWKKDTAKDVSDWIKSGLTIERLPNEEAAARFHSKPDCAIHNKPVQGAPL